jgi:MarR family 2-MHQ and catechol resistance regulon transcriptional repressor
MSRPAPDSIDTATGLAEAAEALHEALADLVRVYQFRDRDRICCHDISVTQCHALEALVRRGPSRLGDLATELYLDKSTASRVVAVLERKGYVARRPDAGDARAVQLTATAAGRRLHDRIRRDLVAEARGLIRDLDPGVWEGATRLLQRLARAAETRALGISCGPSGSGTGEPGCGGAC